MNVPIFNKCAYQNKINNNKKNYEANKEPKSSLLYSYTSNEYASPQRHYYF